TGTAWSAQVLPPGGREHVTAERVDVDGYLSNRLTGIEQIQHPSLACHCTHCGSRVDQTTVGGHVGDGDQFDSLVDRLAQSLNRELAMRIVGDDLNGRPSLTCYVQKGEVIAGILRHGCEDAISRAQGDSVKGHIPGTRGILHKSNFLALAPEQHGRRIVDVLDCVVGLFCRFVPSQERFALHMADYSMQNWLRHERRTCIVEMQHRFTSRSLISSTEEIDGHRVCLP